MKSYSKCLYKQRYCYMANRHLLWFPAWKDLKIIINDDLCNSIFLTHEANLYVTENMENGEWLRVVISDRAHRQGPSEETDDSYAET